MNRESLAWAAGFYEGEGSCSRYWQNDRKSPVVILSIPQVEREPLERFNNIFGGQAKIYTRTAKSESHSDCHVLQTRKFEVVQHIVASIWPWLSSKRRGQITECFNTLAEYRLKRPGVPGIRCNRGHDLTVPDNIYVWNKSNGSQKTFCVLCRRITAKERSNA